MSPVRSNQNAESCVKTLPLSGDERPEYQVVGRDAVGCDHQQMVAQDVEIPYFTAPVWGETLEGRFEERGRGRHGVPHHERQERHAARGEDPAASGWRRIRSDYAVSRSTAAGVLPRLALSDRSIAILSATRDRHHGPLAYRRRGRAARAKTSDSVRCSTVDSLGPLSSERGDRMPHRMPRLW